MEVQPYALISEGTEQKCPLPSEQPVIQSPFSTLTSWEEVNQNQLTVWAVDGSAYYLYGRPVAGYAAIQEGTGRTLQGTVKPPSAQAA